ncbi:MAG: hypothetical protein ACKPEY_17825 [Planctomycetota bacterium]
MSGISELPRTNRKVQLSAPFSPAGKNVVVASAKRATFFPVGE